MNEITIENIASYINERLNMLHYTGSQANTRFFEAGQAEAYKDIMAFLGKLDD